jgi:hypothetical protein
MVKVEKSSDGKIATLSGSECEVMLFYCFWQSKLWADWMNHSKLGDESDAATRQHKSVIENVNAGRELKLYDVGEQFKTACHYAIERCRLLGVEVNAA